MKDELISYSTLKLALEKGFIQPTDYFLTEVTQNYVDARGDKTPDTYSVVKKVKKRIPVTQSLLQRWLREEHNMHADICFNKGLGYRVWLTDAKEDVKVVTPLGESSTLFFKTYEEALERELFEALNLIK